MYSLFFSLMIESFLAYQQFKQKELLRVLNLPPKKSFFAIIKSLFQTNNHLWFPEFSKIDKNLSSYLSSLTKENYAERTEQYLKELVYIRKKEENPECKLALSYIKSRILDRKDKLFYGCTHSLELLKRHLIKGDILLLSKKNRLSIDLWSNLLKCVNDLYLTNFTHCMIFLKKDRDALLVRHATQRTSQGIAWIEETSLEDYLFSRSRCNVIGCDILVLRPKDRIKKAILKFSEERVWGKYDFEAALLQGLDIEQTEDERYNCVELITQGINSQKESYQKLRKKKFPNDFLAYLNDFKPIYLGTLRQKD